MKRLRRLLLINLLMILSSLTALAKRDQLKQPPLAPLASDNTMPHSALQVAWEDYQSLKEDIRL